MEGAAALLPSWLLVCPTLRPLWLTGPRFHFLPTPNPAASAHHRNFPLKQTRTENQNEHANGQKQSCFSFVSTLSGKPSKFEYLCWIAFHVHFAACLRTRCSVLHPDCVDPSVVSIASPTQPSQLQFHSK